jgi:ornithine cyclodeaminase
MRFISAAEIGQVLDRAGLVETLRDAFRTDIITPVRHHHTLARPDADATLLLMPAWENGAKTEGFGHLGVKIVSVFPANPAKGEATVQSVYLLFSAETGVPLAVLDGHELTLWRTAAASALAASYLARADSSHLLMIGAGALAGHLIAAHAATRPIDRVTIWSRRPEQALALADRLSRPDFAVQATDNISQALGEADIVSAATLADDPIVRGDRLRPGTHIDLVGGFTPTMREADDACIRRARVYVDTIAAAAKEAGDITQPIASGVLSVETIAGDLFSLCRGEADGRRFDSEITLFKSVGSAIEDLAAAVQVWQRLSAA